MKLSAFKSCLNHVRTLVFVQPNGTVVPLHFHITEAGLTTKHFIDCGGAIREEKKTSFQLWVAHDYEHRLEPKKLLSIIDTYEQAFGAEDLEVEMEYQTDTISRYKLEFADERFILIPQQTNCLAPDACRIPTEKKKVSLASLQNNCCTPGGSCC